MNEPLVSVYVPSHNRSRLLDRAIRSVLAQTYRPLELLIVDDCSSDDTPDTGARYAGESEGVSVRYLRNERPLGACAARNRAIEACRGALVTGLDDDDEFLPDRVLRFVQAWATHPAVYFSNYRVENRFFTRTARFPRRVTAREMRLYNAVGTQVFAPRERILASGAFDPLMPSSQDHDAWMRLILQEGEALNVGTATYLIHKAHDHSRISTASSAVRGKLRFYAKYKAQMDQRERKHQLFQIRKLLHPVTLRDVLVSVPRERRVHEIVLLVWTRFKRVLEKSKPGGDAPMVSVIVPTHNRATMLKRALESVRVQTYRNLEIVVVDDGSQNDTRQVVESFRRECPDLPVRYLRHETARGANAARNWGIREASGYFVTGLDDDDEFLPGRVERLVYSYDDRYAFVCSGYYTVNRRRKRVNRRTGRISLDGLLAITSVVGGQVLVRRDRILQLGGYDEALPAAQDTDMWVRLIDRYGEAWRIGEPLYVAHTAHQLRTTTSADRLLHGYIRFYLKHRRKMSRKQAAYLMFKLRFMRSSRVGPLQFFRDVPLHRKWGTLKMIVKSFLRSRKESTSIPA